MPEQATDFRYLIGRWPQLCLELTKLGIEPAAIQLMAKRLWDVASGKYQTVGDLPFPPDPRMTMSDFVKYTEQHQNSSGSMNYSLQDEETAFHSHLDQHPNDHTARQVFADWLEERSDPRAAGYRALGRAGKYPEFFDDSDGKTSAWSFSDWNWYGQDRHHMLARDWYGMLPSDIRHGIHESRRHLENRVALTFSHLSPERQQELLNPHHPIGEDYGFDLAGRRQMAELHKNAWPFNQMSPEELNKQWWYTPELLPHEFPEQASRYERRNSPMPIDFGGRSYRRGQFIPGTVMFQHSKPQQYADAQPTQPAYPESHTTQPDFSSPEAFGHSLAKAITHHTRDPEQYMQILYMTDRMTPNVLQRLSEPGRLQGIVTHANHHSMHDRWHSEPENEPLEQDEILHGYHDGPQGLVHVGDHRPAETAAHEIMHALDWNQSGYQLSGHPDWQQAWKAELANGDLTDYAMKNASEGLAEFGRFLWTHPNGIEQARKLFPKSYGVMRNWGVV